MTGPTARAVLAALVWTALLQLAAYAIIRGTSRQKLMLAWAAGAGVRLVGLVVFALLVVPAFALPLAPALLWLAALLFVSTLIESYLLNRLAS
jgi:hypothetical protein